MASRWLAIRRRALPQGFHDFVPDGSEPPGQRFDHVVPRNAVGGEEPTHGVRFGRHASYDDPAPLLIQRWTMPRTKLTTAH